MKFATTLVPLVTAFTASVSANCFNGRYAACGNEQGITCCPYGQYCQPWNPFYYQCRDWTGDCQEILTDVDLYGDDIFAVYGAQPEQCARKCAETSGCVAYTFYNANPGSPACYLKRGFGQQRLKKGAVSCKRQAGLIPTPNPCYTAPYGSCGNDGGITCCPNGQYCQPWNPGFYQCVPLPYKCARQLTNVDFYGNDIRVIHGLQPAACCEECARTPGCRAYTFINSNPGSPVCYLKSGEGERRNKVGAVSGMLN